MPDHRAKRLILHIGHGKTGSTSIQRSLRASGPLLREAGILFPDPGRHDNHQLIFPHLHGDLPPDPVQRASLGESNEQIRAQAERLWSDLLRQIETEHPQTIVLSCENQFRPFPPEALQRLTRMAGQIAERTEVWCWLRSPASYFLSNAQQVLKKRPEFQRLSPSRCRDTLEPFLEYGPGPVHVRLFAREVLTGGDAVTDFCAAVLPELDPARLTRGAKEENSSLSAEAMALLQDIFRETRPLPRGYADRKALRKQVASCDTQVPGATRPRLHAPVREMAEARVTDLDWLRETFGITFVDVAPPTLERAEAEARWSKLRDVSDICTVDKARQEALWQTVITCAPRGLLARLLRR